MTSDAMGMVGARYFQMLLCLYSDPFVFFLSVEVVLHKHDGEERMPSKTLPIQRRIVILTRVMQLHGVFACREH